MEFSFGVRWMQREKFAEMKASGRSMGERERFALGLHVPQRFDRVLDIEECFLQSETSMRILNAVREWCIDRSLTIYSTATHQGYLRNLVIREGKNTGDLMVNLVTSTYEPQQLQELGAMLQFRFPQITTIVNNITTRKSQIAVGEREYVQFGPGRIREKLGNRTYHVSANSFFQTNTLQAERLYDVVRRLAECHQNSMVYDLYSGTGTIALHLADAAGHVLGIETVPEAVRDAHRNAEENGIANCTFIEGELKEALVRDNARLAGFPPPEVVVIDPPRAGMHEKVVSRIRHLSPSRIVYVSCNPATQARDIALLVADDAYAVDEVQPVDMFPHTSHVENVVRLIRRSTNSL
jgi:23S rRNA (uracil1939-C5)-methyltransferase